MQNSYVIIAVYFLKFIFIGKRNESKLLDAELVRRLREFVGVTNGNLDTHSMATLAFLYIYLSLFGSGWADTVDTAADWYVTVLE